MNVDRKYLELVASYQKEIEKIRDSYNENRSAPFISPNIPPIASRILWIRQLFKRIETPMEIFKSHDRIIKHEKTQRVIRMYNAIIRVFIHYEMIHHKAWFDSSDVVSLLKPPKSFL